MRTGKLPVHPNPCLVIDTAEMEADPLAFHPVGQVEHSAVPDIRHQSVMADATQLALGTKRHDDFRGELLARSPSALLTIPALIDFKLPFAIERGPVLPKGIGKRVFRTGDFRSPGHAATQEDDQCRK